MITSKEIINFEKLINLFFLFVVGTISFWVYYLADIPDFSWKSGLRFAIFLLGLFSYEFVLLSLISYYMARAKKKVAEDFEKNPRLFYIIATIILGVTYIIINTIIEKSVLIFIRDLVMVLLIVVAMPFVNDFVNKKRKNEN